MQAPTQLGPEQVALLLRLADLIAEGQIPGLPPLDATPQDHDPDTQVRLSRWRRGSKKGTAPTAARSPSSDIDAPPPGDPGAAGLSADLGLATSVVTSAPTASPSASAGGPGKTTSGGQDSGPPLTSPPDRAKTSKATDRRSTKRTLLIGAFVGAVALAGLVVAYAFMSSEAPPPVPRTELTMPAAVGNLVPVTSTSVSEELTPLIGFGLRPAGVTITGAYGPKARGPVTLATMATTVPTPNDAAGQLATWAGRTGATVDEPVVGTGPTAGVTCAAVTKHPDAQPGSFCAWAGSGARGHTYVVGAEPEAALEQTAEFRSALDASQAVFS